MWLTHRLDMKSKPYGGMKVEPFLIDSIENIHAVFVEYFVQMPQKSHPQSDMIPVFLHTILLESTPMLKFLRFFTLSRTQFFSTFTYAPQTHRPVPFLLIFTVLLHEGQGTLM